ncbi:hypothetical protein GCM10022406_01330 [Hymenobacter algoricola]|uniref:Uncharacterized protein n=2 Tax=Hymenobacter algoricola TaxID=486267 RepID=A0ABP7M9N5_9BACT
MQETQVGLSLYQSSRASLELNGKLNDGTLLSFTFRQSSTAAGANRTDLVDVRMNGTITATQASGTTLRDAGTNAVSGTFSCKFATGLQVDGVITNLQLR